MQVSVGDLWVPFGFFMAGPLIKLNMHTSGGHGRQAAARHAGKCYPRLFAVLAPCDTGWQD
jgi:hypothetical protein